MGGGVVTDAGRIDLMPANAPLRACLAEAQRFGRHLMEEHGLPAGDVASMFLHAAAVAAAVDGVRRGRMGREELRRQFGLFEAVAMDVYAATAAPAGRG